MASGRPIGNMTIKVDLDQTGFSRSMTGLKRQLKSVNKEMGANLSQFDRSEVSADKYRVKIESLTKRHQIQGKAVEQARSEYDKMVDTHGANSVAAQSAAQDYNESLAMYQQTGRVLEGVKSDFASFQKQQEIQSSNWYKAGDAMQNFGGKMQNVSARAREVGGSLTRKLTLPALGVATAVGGMFAKAGWDRLVGLDSAQAKLKGLGYSTEEVGDISDTVTDAIEGGMTTMAEGVDIAAGAMAAGVDEGKDLEKYIQLVGDAAVGSNRPVDEMAQIFNRVQGGGRLMTQELNQIEHGMPGFSNAMAKHLGVTVDELREMVTAGEVSSDDFLTVMDDFAGGMAEEYANSWQGMVQNTKAYVGILGEELMGGVFEKSKESIAEFIEMLKSDEAKAKAKEIGETISDVFTKVVDTVKNVVNWYMDLSDWQKDLINKVALFAVAIGPLLVGLSAVGGIVGKLMVGFGGFSKAIAGVGGLFKGVGVVFSTVGGIFGKVIGVIKPLAPIFMTIGKTVGAFLITPLGATIGIVAALAAGFIVLYKRSETFRNIVHAVGEKIAEIASKVWEITKNVATWIGEKMVWLKDKFFEVFDWIREKISTFTSWFGEVWTNTMERISNTTSRIMEVVKNVFNFGLNNLLDLISFFRSVFTGDWKGAFESVRSITDRITSAIWNLIKDSFIGRIITAVVGFGTKFRESISNMWSNIKATFLKRILEVRTGVDNSFVGKILNLIYSLSTNFRDTISNMWNRIKQFFSNAINIIVGRVKNSFVGRIISSIIDFVKNFKERVNDLWNAIKRTFKNSINSVYNRIKNSFVGRIISSIVDFIKNFKTRIGDMWSSLKRTFKNSVNSIYNRIKNSFVGRMIKSITTLKDDFISLAGDMWTGVKDKFDDIVEGAKNLPGRIGKGIKNAKDKATDGMKTVGNTVIKWAGKPFNKVVDGVNWVTGKLGVKSKIGKWDYPQYAKGTGGHGGGPAILGDGKGNNSGSEFVSLPNGSSFLSASTPTLYPDLPKGTQVMPAKESKQLPFYAKGTKGWFGKMKESIGDVWDYVKKPSKIVGKIMDKIGIKKGMAQIPRKIVSGGFNYLKTKPVEFIKNMFGKAESEGGGPAGPAGTGAKRWRSTIKMASARMNANASAREINGIIAQIQRESGGNQKIVQSNAVWDVNTAAGNPARGLLQYIPQTFAAYKTRGHGNIYNGYHQLRAFFNNSTWRRDLPYGRRGWGPRGANRGYATGGLIKSKQMAMLGEEGPEMVIPLERNRRNDAMKLLALTGQMLGADGNSKRPGQLPNVKGSNNTEELLEATLKQNEILMNILNKDTNVYFDGDDVTEKVNNKNAINDKLRYI